MEQKDEKHSLTRQDIEQHLQSALAAATPNVWSKLDLSVPQDAPKEPSKVLRMTRKLRYLGAAAACICLIAGGGVYHYEYLQVASVVGIDVNPSLRISLNRRDKVLKAEALNSDGVKVLDAERELRGETLEAAMNQVVDSLIKEGYLKEGQQRQAVLVSVSGKNEKQAEKVKTAAAANMEDAIAQKQVSAVVYDQTIQVTKELEELAEAYQVSVGKAGFIEQLVQENETLNQDTQAAYERMMSQSMEVITQEIHENEYSVNSRVNVVHVEPAGEKEPKKGSEEGYSQKPKEMEDVQRERSDEDAENQQDKTEVREQEPESSPAEDRSSDTKEEERAAEDKAKAESDEETIQENSNRENQKKPENDREPDTEDQTEENREETKKQKEEENDAEKSSDLLEGEEVSPDTAKPVSEATSSTVEAETSPKELPEPKEGEGRAEELEKNGDKAGKTEEESDGNNAEETKEKTGADKADGFQGDADKAQEPEEDADKAETGAHQKETGQEHFVEYSQPVDDQLFFETLQPVHPVKENTAEDKEQSEKEEKEEEKLPEEGLSEQEKAEELTKESLSEDSKEKEPAGEVLSENDAAQEPVSEAQQNRGDEESAETNSSDHKDDKNAAKESPAADDQEKREKVEESESGHQVIRVNVEEKEHKKTEEPVYASQLLGFSQRRLLCKGPGVFAFIIADPGSGRQEEDDQEDEFEEDLALEEEEEPEDELEENWTLEEDWQMGEWLRIGPGYH